MLLDLIVAVSSVDQQLERDTRDLSKARSKVDVRDNKCERVDIIQEIHSKYKGERYSLIVSPTSGEAGCVVRGVVEKGL